TSCWPGSLASRTACEPPAGRGRIPSAPMTTPDVASHPTAALSRRELVVAAVVMVALTRAVEPADAFLVVGLLPVVMLVAGVGVLNLGAAGTRPYESLIVPAVLTGGTGAAIHLVPVG